MKKISIVCVCLLLILSGVGLTTALENDTIYVDDDGTADYTSIQDAINAANDGDTIFVYAGQYHESIRIDKSLHLIGENKDETIIDATSSSVIYVVLISHPNVSLEGFSLIDRDDLWELEFSVIDVKASSSSITNNIIKTDLCYGIHLHPYVKENQIRGNYITAASAGIRLDFTWDNLITENHFIGGNHVDAELGINYSQDKGIDAKFSFHNTIVNNHFEDNGMGVFLTNCYGNNFSQNNFIDKGDDVYMHPRFSVNSWNNNYWKDYEGKIPFYIVTQRYLPFTNIPLVFWFDIFRIDWNPASVPFDINGGIR